MHVEIYDAYPTQRNAALNADAFDFRLWLRLESQMQLTAAV